MSDELDDYEAEVEAEDEIEDALDDEVELADADEIVDVESERDETPFDETRLQYSGVEEGDGDVDVEEYAEAGALFDDPEKTVLLDDGADDPDGSGG
ncbi:MAG: hypothetical protein ABW328_22215 [Ilumatobacteraceae bacterium]